MTIHKEGRRILLTLFILIAIVDLLAYWQLMENHSTVAKYAIGVSLLVFLFFLNFFRNPNRVFDGFEEGMIVAPADGTVVVIEPTIEDEYLKEKRIQVSIFMSVFNVHANWYPTSGKVIYYTHNNGRFMAANLPKSSIENERSTVVVETRSGVKILFRQVAGALARRIVTYSREGEECCVNQQMGFIKFGSRVDLFLPLDAEILVNMKQCVTGNKTVIARLKK
ncbi:MAG: phosphatidylserine decarboxylase family protein [Prevotellaceae bacterium]|jgi:phosphatidylserine decarboxylase|nr:phosphatidylserine decarboxylase family protein [Prevotellaceae bacterium]